MQPTIRLQGAQTQDKSTGIFTLKRSVHEIVEAGEFRIPCRCHEIRGGIVHAVQQGMTGFENGLPVAPRQGGGKESGHSHILWIGITVRDAQRIVVQKIRPLKALGRLIQPLAPLGQPCSGGTAVKWSGTTWRTKCGHGRQSGAKFAH